MSWLARSIANSLRLDDEQEQDLSEERNPNDAVPRPSPNDAVPPEDLPRDNTEDLRSSDSDGNSSYNHGGDEDSNQGRGVKEDLSEFKDSLTRQLWGVASFLAPPPLPLNHSSVPLRLNAISDGAGSLNDDEEDGALEYDERDPGQFGELAYEDYYASIIEDAIGITDEVLAFAKNIAHHPETWLDFPLSEEEEFDDFDISDAQHKHARAVELLSPRLAALRIELCPVHMSEGYFWMVYFVLLHSRLNKHDADLLSSPQIVQARAVWMQELHKQTKESYLSGMSTVHLKEIADSPRENFVTHSYEEAHFGRVTDHTSTFESSMHQMTALHEIKEHSFNKIEFVDNSVIKEDPAPEMQEREIVVVSSIEVPVQDDNDDDDDDWLKEDSDVVGYFGTSIIVNEEDISFSDLEDDLDCTKPTKYKIVLTEGNTTTKTS